MELTDRVKFLFHTQSGKTDDPDACWLWIGTINWKGYGVVTYHQEKIGAHRLSYLLHKGPIPAGMLVRHTCDNTACVNPRHLITGTYQDNADDAVQRGRVAKLAGERNGMCKLSAEDIEQIRELTKTQTLKAIAKQFGISFQQVSKIKLGQRWARG